MQKHGGQSYVSEARKYNRDLFRSSFVSRWNTEEKSISGWTVGWHVLDIGGTCVVRTSLVWNKRKRERETEGWMDKEEYTVYSNRGEGRPCDNGRRWKCIMVCNSRTGLECSWMKTGFLLWKYEVSFFLLFDKYGSQRNQLRPFNFSLGWSIGIVFLFSLANIFAIKEQHMFICFCWNMKKFFMKIHRLCIGLFWIVHLLHGFHERNKSLVKYYL